MNAKLAQVDSEYLSHNLRAHYRLAADLGQMTGYVKSAIAYLEAGADTIALNILRHAIALQVESDRKRDETK